MTTRTYEITSKKGLSRTFDELKQKIEEVENQAKEMMRAGKSPIYRDYAAKVAVFIPPQYVCEEFCRHFPKDESIIRYALKNSEYTDKSKDRSNHEEEKDICDNVTTNEDKKRIEDLKDEIEYYKDFYKQSDIRLDYNLLQKCLRDLDESPDAFIITQEKGFAVGVRAA